MSIETRFREIARASFSVYNVRKGQDGCIVAIHTHEGYPEVLLRHSGFLCLWLLRDPKKSIEIEPIALIPGSECSFRQNFAYLKNCCIEQNCVVFLFFPSMVCVYASTVEPQCSNPMTFKFYKFRLCVPIHASNSNRRQPRISP